MTTSIPTSATSPNKSNGRTRIAVAVGLVAAVGVAVAGTHWWTHGRFIEDTDDAYIGGDVTVISAKVPGYIVNVAVTDNQVVHAGDLLAKLDDRDYRAALSKAEGAVAAQRALIANLDANRALQQAVIAEARAGVAATGAETMRAHDDQDRFSHLVSRAAVSVQSAQKADADYKQAVAGGQKAQAALAAAERQLDVIATQRQQASAALAQAQAERDLASLNLGYTELRAPIDGIVGNRHARNGAYAAASSQLMAIVPTHGLWVDANFKESQLAHMQPGEPAVVIADAVPGHRFEGRVVSVSPATGAQFSVLPPENATGNFTKIVQRVPVRIALNDADALVSQLRPGLSVTADVDAHSNRDR
ncbi:MAG: HlyD family secretion protein [Burkholderiales bacterium]|nr:HlyD family secretion protein [Burkholderiales bacterium]